jgi:hypothetical protein
VYLPADFHSANFFNRTLLTVEKDLGDASVLEKGKIDAPLLLLGLMYREVSRSMEIEPDAPTRAPVHLVNSPFGIKEIKKIERIINSVVLPSQPR